MESSSDEMNQYTIGSVFIRCELYLHGSKLNSPSNLIIDGYFQSHWVPVGAIKHLKKIELLGTHEFELLVRNHVVSLKKIGQVIDKFVVNNNLLLVSYFPHPVYVLLFDASVEIVVFFKVDRAVPDIVIGLVVTRTRNIVSMIWITFLRRTVVNWIRNNVPAAIPVRYFAFEEGRSRSYSQKDRAENIQLVVHVSGML